MTADDSLHGLRRNGDPTTNVLDLVNAAVSRQDDLRAAESKFLCSSLANQKEISNLRAEHAKEFGLLKSEHAKELRKEEQARVDAIRQNDVQQRDSQQSVVMNSISSLTSAIAATADTLRTAAQHMATNLAEASTQQNEAVNRRLVALEQASYEGRGKQQVADPQFAVLIEEMKKVQIAQIAVASSSAGGKAMWGYVVGGFGFLLTLLGILSYFASLKP